MRKVFARRLLGLSAAMAMAATGVFGQMNSITALAEEVPLEGLNGESEEESTLNAGEKAAQTQEGDAAEADKGSSEAASAEAASDEKAPDKTGENTGAGEADRPNESDEVNQDKETAKDNEAGSKEETTKDSETGSNEETEKDSEAGKKEAAPEDTKDGSKMNNDRKDKETESDSKLLGEGVSIDSVVVNTEVKKLGQYPVSMTVTFEEALAEDVALTADDFSIKADVTGWLAADITKSDVPVEVESVSLSEDRKNLTIVPGTFPDRYYYVPEYTVTCVADGQEYFSFKKSDVTKTVTPVADDFKHVSENGFNYNIYEPETDEAVPAVVVFHGFGDDENLYANRIAVEWAMESNQAVRPAYVIAPQFGGYAFAMEDARKGVYANTKALIDSLVKEGKVDPSRIYITGKSFGGASVIEFNEIYPEYPAASIAMAPAVAYTDYFPNVTTRESLAKIKDRNLWIAQCDEDTTAPYAGTAAAYEALKNLGCGDNITFTTYTMDELTAGGADNAHAIECVVMDDAKYAEWLFSKVKEIIPDPSEPETDYEVITPEGYPAEGTSYPVVYVMPNDGLSKFSETALSQLKTTLNESAMDMIIVKVKFEKGDDPYSEVEHVIKEVDEKYSTLKDASYRAVIGEEVGGYLAHALTYTDGKGKFNAAPALFGLMASINGDYSGKDNLWLGSYGDMLSISSLNVDTGLKFYTYLSAASEDPRAYSENGANSIIQYFIKQASGYPLGWGYYYMDYFGTADAYTQNFSIKNGSFDEAFEKKSVDEAARGFNRRITRNLVTGSLSLSPQSALKSVEDIKASYSITVSDSYTRFFGKKESRMTVKIVMTDPDDGTVLETVPVGEFNVLAGNITGEVTIPNLVNNVSTSVSLVATLQGTTFAVDTQDLVRILDTGSAPEDQVIDFMGVWKVKPIEEASFNKEDYVGENGKLALSADEYNSWKDATPCITWWNGTNGVAKNFVGYAWYVREFDIPADFVKGTYQMPIGYLDEGDVTFINGVQIGQTGMDPDAWTFESDQWDTYRSYEVSPDILNFGGKNYVAVLAHNKSGDGGWYKGHPGLYSQAAYNKLNSAPSTVAAKEPKALVEKAVKAQITAIAAGNLKKYADTVSPDYFQSGIDKESLLGTVAGYGKAKITDSEDAVFEADGGLYLYQARRTIVTESGETIQKEVNDYFRTDGKKALLYGLHDRFYTQYIDSKNRALALGSGNETEKESFLVYLPEGYFDEANADKRYPVAYIFHQINSSSNSWKIDGINEFLDSGISAGLIKNTILVIPDSVPTSWWKDSWVDMVTDDIIPFIDENYRTVKDARFRFTVGASMGGSGSYNIGLRNPDLFSGIISYFGAINMGANPLGIAKDQYEKGYTDYLKYYGQYFVCGNQDLYKFGIPAIELDSILRNVKIDHYFELEEGAHDSTFYKPYVVDSFSYMTSRIPSVSAEEAGKVLDVNIESAAVSKGRADAVINVKVDEAVKDYLALIPASDYTKNTNPDLVVPVTVRLVDEDGVTVASKSVYTDVNGGRSESFSFGLESYDIEKSENYRLVAAANLLDYPCVAAVSIKGKKAVAVVTPAKEADIASGDETPASQAMGDAEAVNENTSNTAGADPVNVSTNSNSAKQQAKADAAVNKSERGASNKTSNKASSKSVAKASAPSVENGAAENNKQNAENASGSAAENTADTKKADSNAGSTNAPAAPAEGNTANDTKTAENETVNTPSQNAETTTAQLEESETAKAATVENGGMSTNSMAFLIAALAAIAVSAVVFGFNRLNKR